MVVNSSAAGVPVQGGGVPTLSTRADHTSGIL